jgi:hypothetical protein
MAPRTRFARIVLTATIPAFALLAGLGTTAATATASTTPTAAQRAHAEAIARAAIKNIVVGFEHSPTLKVTGRHTSLKGLSQVESTNWAGYADTGSGFSKVSANWTEPTGVSSGSTTSLAAFWVGIDGYSSDTVEQDGTLIESYEGTVY